MFSYRSFTLLAAVMLLNLFACAPVVPATPTITPMPVVRPTLPPTWTLSPTLTPAPPTATVTPVPTLTRTPTLSPETICDSLQVQTNLENTHILAWDHQITVFVSTPLSDLTVRFLAVHHATSENKGIELPGGQSVIFQLPVKQLPRPGRYDWTLAVQSEAYGDLCEHDGWFIATRRESTRAEESEIR